MDPKCGETLVPIPTPVWQANPHVCRRPRNHEGPHECWDGRRWETNPARPAGAEMDAISALARAAS